MYCVCCMYCVYCVNCMYCLYCVYCVYCVYCMYCVYCVHCVYCVYCMYCVYCVHCVYCVCCMCCMYYVYCVYCVYSNMYIYTFHFLIPSLKDGSNSLQLAVIGGHTELVEELVDKHKAAIDYKSEVGTPHMRWGRGPHIRWGRWSSHEVGEVVLTWGGGGVLT